jgi:hypothetical protein
MALITDLMGLGLPPELATKIATPTIDALPVLPAGAALTATGSALSDALLLTATVNNVTTAAASTGVKLNANTPIGATVVVRNGGANDLKLYPSSASDQINGTTAGSAITLTTANKQIATCTRVSSTLWVATVATGT